MDEFDDFDEKFGSKLDDQVARDGAIIDPWANVNLLKRQGDIPALKRVRRKRSFVRPDPAGYAASRAAAQARGEDTFTALCFAHGPALFDTARGPCLACEANVAGSDLPPERVAEIVGASHYDRVCETHGPSLFHTGSERCAECTALVIGRPGNPVRLAARRSGETTYPAVCSVHGEAPHHTIRGKCMRCFNSLGYPRKR